VSDDLVGFLRERLDEDEHQALDWQQHKHTLTEQFMNDSRRKHVRLWRKPVTDTQLSEYAYNDRFDPARALREVEAKRRIVNLHTRAEDAEGDSRTWCPVCGWREFPCLTLRMLALPHADHPDYREEWRP
jgi:hypothetical protein